MNKNLLMLAVPALLLGAALGAAGDVAHVGRTVIRSGEKSFEVRLRAMWPDTPQALIGGVRGVYLDGYGAVFTAEINMATENVSLMHPLLNNSEKENLHKLKVQRLPMLKTALQQALAEVGPTLDPVPMDEQIV